MLRGLCSSAINTTIMPDVVARIVLTLCVCFLAMMHPAVDAKNVHTGACD